MDVTEKLALAVRECEALFAATGEQSLAGCSLEDVVPRLLTIPDELMFAVDLGLEGNVYRIGEAVEVSCLNLWLAHRACIRRRQKRFDEQRLAHCMAAATSHSRIHEACDLLQRGMVSVTESQANHFHFVPNLEFAGGAERWLISLQRSSVGEYYRRYQDQIPPDAVVAGARDEILNFVKAGRDGNFESTKATPQLEAYVAIFQKVFVAYLRERISRVIDLETETSFGFTGSEFTAVCGELYRRTKRRQLIVSTKFANAQIKSPPNGFVPWRCLRISIPFESLRSEVTRTLALEEEAVGFVLDAISMKFDDKPGRVSIYAPVTRPIARIGGRIMLGAYLFEHARMAFAFEDVLSEEQKQLAGHRFVDSMAETLKANVKWRVATNMPTDDGDVDLLFLADGVLFIFECKAFQGRPTIDRVQRRSKDLEKASGQLGRARRFVEDHLDRVAFRLGTRLDEVAQCRRVGAILLHSDFMSGLLVGGASTIHADLVLRSLRESPAALEREINSPSREKPFGVEPARGWRSIVGPYMFSGE